MHTDMTAPRYSEFLMQYASDPNMAYNAMDYAGIQFFLSDEKGKRIFEVKQPFTADQVKIAPDRAEGSWGQKCHIRTRQKRPHCPKRCSMSR